jgi:hypothetical protein
MRRNMRRLAKEMEPGDEDGNSQGGKITLSGTSSHGFGSPGGGAWPSEGAPTGASPLSHAMLSSMIPSNAEHLNRAFGQIKELLASKVEE